MAVNTVMQIKLQTESHLGNKEAVYEYFSPLGPEQESLRTASKKDFEEGIRCMEEKRFLEGRTLFVRVLQANRDDLAAGHYFRVCDGGWKGELFLYPAIKNNCNPFPDMVHWNIIAEICKDNVTADGLRRFYMCRIIGAIVTVTVDRPLGSHHPKYKDMCYPVNYGYIAGVMAPDGEEQDAYIIGVDKAVKEFTGRVIAVVHRLNDVEEKWVVASDRLSFDEDEIMEQIWFQERYFKSEIRMKIQQGI